MRCCVPFCRSTADNAAGADEVTFHNFPLDVTLCTKWLSALGIHDQPLKDSAVVCSQHFLEDDFCNAEDCSRQVRFGVIPSAVKLCMICLDMDRNVASLRKYNLEEAYEKLTGQICREGYLKQTLCMECAQHLMNFEKFRFKTLRASAVMMNLVEKDKIITMQHIAQINNMREQLQSDIVNILAPNHCDQHIKENNNEDTQTDNTVPDNDAIKVEETHTIDIKIEKEDPVDYDEDNVSDAGILMDIKVETIKLDCPACCKVFSNEDTYNTHYKDGRHAECGGELAHRTHTTLHSQHRETNQAWKGASSADYPHTSVIILPTQKHDVTFEKKNTLETNFQTLGNETDFKFVEILSDKLQAITSIPESETSNKQNFLQEYFCDHCEYKCRVRDNIVKHLKKHTIEERLSSKRTLASDIRVHSGQKAYSCKLCNFASKHKTSLVRHMRFIHTVEIPFSCKLCDFESKCKSSLVKHMRLHTEEIPFSCKLCDFASKHKKCLVRHMRIHSGKKPFSCKLCDFASEHKTSLESHMRIHTGEKPFSCKLCVYVGRQRGHLVRHMRIHTGEKPFSCKLCNFATKDRSSLVFHKRIHTGEKPYSYKVCEYACSTKGDLVNHTRIHTDEKPFSCKLCEFASKCKSDLMKHIRIHTSEKRFSCVLCEYACRRKGDLIRHTRIHTGEKPFSCNSCEYASKDKTTLLRHMRIHTGEKPYSCNLCEYVCRKKGDLVKHTRIHTSENFFSCNSCEYTCKSKSELVRHITVCE